MIRIALNRGLCAVIDDDDFELVSQCRWLVIPGRKGRFYAYSTVKVPAYGRKMLMHRLIMGSPKGMQVDHRNEDDTLDNRKSNLRVATHGQNQMNTGKHAHNTTGYKGVYLEKRTGKYRGRVIANKRSYVRRGFSTPEEAYAFVCEKIKEHHGEFAHL
jgi:hypothetical protein